MNIVMGVLAIVLGLWVVIDPISALKFEDLFRINGEREYSDIAIGFTQLSGIISIILGLVAFFIKF